MAAIASSPTSPTSSFLHLAAGANYVLLRDTPPLPGRGPHHNAVLLPPERKKVTAAPAPANAPEQGDGSKTNGAVDVVEMKLRVGGAVRQPTPPPGPREGHGGSGGVIHAVAAGSSPQRPGSPAEGAGGKGGAVHAAAASS